MLEPSNNGLFKEIVNDAHTGIQRETFSSPDYELLCEAIKLGHMQTACDILNKNGCIHKSKSTVFLLHSVIDRLNENSGWTDIMLKLLYAGARVSDANTNGDTVLHLAFKKHVDGDALDILIRMYLEESGEDTVNMNGLSVLHIACTRPNVQFLRQLLEKKANVNRLVPHPIRKFAGQTPLHTAVKFGNHEVADLLLKRGAHIYVEDANKSTPLHLACYRRDSKMIDLILTYDRITANVVDSNGLTHFMVACTSKEPAFAKEHLRVADCKFWTSSRILINSSTKNDPESQFPGYTPLHFSAEFGSDEVFNLLLTRGAHCCAMNGQLLTPLKLALIRGHVNITEIFECDCKENQENEDTILTDKNIAILECTEQANNSVSIFLIDGESKNISLLSVKRDTDSFSKSSNGSSNVSNRK